MPWPTVTYEELAPYLCDIKDSGESVYIAMSKLSDRHVKIGRSENVKARLRSLKCDLLIELACKKRFSAPLEAMLHERFKEHRSFGEWFDARPVYKAIHQAFDRDRSNSFCKILIIDNPFCMDDETVNDLPNGDGNCIEDEYGFDFDAVGVVSPDGFDFGWPY